MNRGSLVVLPPDQAGKGARLPHLRAASGQDFHLRSCRSRVSGFKACAYPPLARFPRATLRRPRRVAWVAASDRKRGLLRCWRQRDYSLNPRSHVACTIRCTTRSVAVDWLGRREPHHAVRVLALGWRSPKVRCSPVVDEQRTLGDRQILCGLNNSPHVNDCILCVPSRLYKPLHLTSLFAK